MSKIELGWPVTATQLDGSTVSAYPFSKAPLIHMGWRQPTWAVEGRSEGYQPGFLLLGMKTGDDVVYVIDRLARDEQLAEYPDRPRLYRWQVVDQSGTEKRPLIAARYFTPRLKVAT